MRVGKTVGEVKLIPSPNPCDFSLATSACYEDMLGVTIPADGTDREFLLALKAEWAKLVEQVGEVAVSGGVVQLINTHRAPSSWIHHPHPRRLRRPNPSCG